MGNVLLVVDMVVGFMVEGHNLYCGDESRSIIPNICSLIEDHQFRGDSVIFICDSHEPNDLEFEMFPFAIRDVCLAGRSPTRARPTHAETQRALCLGRSRADA